MTLLLSLLFILVMLETFALFGRHHINTMLAVRGKYSVESGQVHSWLWHQGGQLGNEIQWFEDDVRRAIVVGRFEMGIQASEQ